MRSNIWKYFWILRKEGALDKSKDTNIKDNFQPQLSHNLVESMITTESIAQFLAKDLKLS